VSFSDQQLAEAAESYSFLWDDAVPVVTPLGIPGLQGRITPAVHPFLNMVGRARLDEAAADAAIEALRSRFAAEGKLFAWMVGPDTSPADLPTRLQAAGLQKVGEAAGMALTDLDRRIPPNPSVRVEEVGLEEMRGATDLIARAMGFGLTPDAATAMIDIMDVLRERYDSRAYLAFVDDGADPVAFSLMQTMPEQRIACLVLSGTLEEYRGRGVYTSLVARRAADARARGAAAVVIQAYRDTSAPICQKIGFREVCALDVYALPPADA
jgi:GNAT superfamily N-acetyltransferase